MSGNPVIAYMSRALRALSETEHGPVINRATIGVLVSLYFISPWFDNDVAHDEAIRFIAISYVAIALILLISVFAYPGVSILRRVIGAVTDISAVSMVLLYTGEAGMPLVAVYLWVIVGYGFRYGLRYLVLTTVLSLTGFSIVLWRSGLWYSSPDFSITLLIMLTIIPFYLGLLIQRLQRAINKAKEASRAKSKFLANMSHELRTPLNGVIGMSDLLMESQLDRKQMELANSIQTSAGVLLGVIENVLDFSRIEAGKMLIDHSDFDLHSVMSDTMNLFIHQARRKGLKFTAHIDPNTPFMLVGDSFHLRQILINLIGNAIKFTLEGRVELRVTAVSIADEQVSVRFEIEDTGIGIDEKDQASLFDSFQQVDASTTRRFGGTGLGTAIARQLVTLMGGNIGLHSQPDKGTCFWFEIPFAIQEESQIISKPAMENARILLLTSAQATQELSASFKQWNLTADRQETSARAFARLVEASENGRPYSVVLIEQEALDMTPEQFASVVRAESLLDGVSLVLVQQDGQADDDYFLGIGYSSVLHSHPDNRLLYNALHAARVEHKMPENVVSLTQHYEQQLGGLARSLRILVAEDNETNQQVLRGILEGVGHVVSLTTDGLAALDAIEMSDAGFDLMIFDLNMPQMGGLEAMKMARFMDLDRHVPTIILTADATKEALRRCDEAGAEAYLTKPVESRRLLETIARLCRDDVAGAMKKQTAGHGVSDQRDISGKDILIDENVLQGLLRLGSGIEFFEELVASFGRDVKNLIKRMRRAVSELDYPALQDSAHALRGSASEFGAYRMVNLCINIKELKPYDMSTKKPAALLEEVEQAFISSSIILDEFARTRREASR